MALASSSSWFFSHLLYKNPQPYPKADPAKRGMGCTVDALYLSGGRVYVGHVGDSRVYRLREGQLTQMTEDHSLLNDFRRVKEMSGEELGDFAQTHKNVVVRALGLADHVRVDTVVEDYKLGDLYLLCSDGLSDMIEDDQIREIMMSKSQRLDGAAQALVDAANDAGGRDNITALLAQVLDG